jgi:peptidoglycan/LPS O-acetylase OafA/YrhL
MQTIRLGWIESLRGIAALLVVFVHLLNAADRARYLDHSHFLTRLAVCLGRDWLDVGKAGVVIFFLVSGWLVPRLVEKQDLRGFLSNRFFRLYPAYWLSIAWTVLFCYNPGWPVVLMNATMFHQFFGINDLISVYWTLQIELLFYLLCLALRTKGWLSKSPAIKKVIWACLAASFLIAVARFFTGLKLPVALPLGLAVMLVAHLWRLSAGQPEQKKELKQVLAVFALVFVPVCLLAYNRDYGYHETWYRYLSSYTAAFLIFAWFERSGAESRVFMFLGKISYSLYLLHLVTGVAFIHYASKLKLDQTLGIGSVAGIAITYILAVSTFSYYCVERPFVRWGKRYLPENA